MYFNIKNFPFSEVYFFIRSLYNTGILPLVKKNYQTARKHSEWPGILRAYKNYNWITTGNVPTIKKLV